MACLAASSLDDPVLAVVFDGIDLISLGRLQNPRQEPAFHLNSKRQQSGRNAEKRDIISNPTKLVLTSWPILTSNLSFLTCPSLFVESPRGAPGTMGVDQKKAPRVCVVTGGSGFVGQRLVEMLLERGAERVVSFDIADRFQHFFALLSELRRWS